MGSLLQNSVGIQPPGALGVSLFHHLTAGSTRIEEDVFFLERPGSASAAALRACGELRIARVKDILRLPTAGLLKPDLIQCRRQHTLPEVLLVCPNPDQLLGVLDQLVALIEVLFQKEPRLETPLPIPIVVLCSNGIYFQRVRLVFIEKIEEATLLGRLPDLWPDRIPLIVGRLLRGVTIQTGIRESAGGTTLYRPGPRGITRLAGGDAASRERCARLLTSKGGWYEVAAHESATRLEFDKALVNLAANLLGQLFAIDDQGRFRLLTVHDIVTEMHAASMRELAGQVFKVGRAVKAYGPDDRFEDAYARLLENLRGHERHVPSSLQWVDLKLRQGTLGPELTPTETWLLDPLIRYARSSGLESTGDYFKGLRMKLVGKLTRAAQRQATQSPRTPASG
jgi:hypothetical protein